MKKLFFILGGVALVAGAGLLNWYEGRNVVLSERPAAKIVSAELPQEESTIGIRARAEYATLHGLLSNLTSKPYTDAGADTWNHQTWLKTKGAPKCRVYDVYKITCEDTWIKTKGPKLSVGYRWDLTVQRNGDISLGPNGKYLRVTVPVVFKGNAGLRGDGAKILKLHKKNFEGSLTVFLDIAMDLDEKWCPKIQVQESHKWNSKARIEIIDGIFVSVSGIADDMIKDMKSGARKAISDAFTCELIQKAVAPLWARTSIAVPVADRKEIYVNAEPLGIAFSGIIHPVHDVAVAAPLGERESSL